MTPQLRSIRKADLQTSSSQAGEKFRGAIWLACDVCDPQRESRVVPAPPCSRLPLRRYERGFDGRFCGSRRPMRQDARTAVHVVSYFYQNLRSLRNPAIDALAESHKADALTFRD